MFAKCVIGGGVRLVCPNYLSAGDGVGARFGFHNILHLIVVYLSGVTTGAGGWTGIFQCCWHVLASRWRDSREYDSSG